MTKILSIKEKLMNYILKYDSDVSTSEIAVMTNKLSYEEVDYLINELIHENICKKIDSDNCKRYIQILDYLYRIKLIKINLTK